MYIHNAARLNALSEDKQTTIQRRNAPFSKIVGKELVMGAIVREKMRDTTSAALQIKGPRQAEALHLAEITVFRKQLDSLPEGLLEEARRFRSLQENIRQKDLQDFQFTFMLQFEDILKSLRDNIINESRREQLLSKSTSSLSITTTSKKSVRFEKNTTKEFEKSNKKKFNIHKLSIGGYDEGIYETFFRVEPARYMTKAQFATAIRHCFANEIKVNVVSHLFDSFDMNRCDEMEWRSFLYLLYLVMFPVKSTFESIKVAFALFSSVGSLDMECTDKMSLSSLKSMIATPAILSLRDNLKFEFQKAWQYLVNTDSQVIQYTAKHKVKIGEDPDEFRIPFNIFEKICKETDFAKMLQPATVFGRRDQRTWTTYIEENYYHPLLLQRMKTRRRELRNEREADEFLAHRAYRRKRFAYSIWIQFVLRRRILRSVFIACEIRSTLANYALYIDHWRRVCIEYRASVNIQRIIRGYLSRRRKKFLRRIQRKVTTVQKTTRKYFVRLRVVRKKMRLQWAAIMIQRIFRGRIARKRVATTVESLYDTQKRLLERAKVEWRVAREIRAATALQMMVRRFLQRRRIVKKIQAQELAEEIQQEMLQRQKEGKLEEEIYRRELSQWYIDRKAEYDKDIFNEKQTRLQKRAILDRRYRLAQEEKKKKAREKEALDQKLREETIELWIKNWEAKIIQRGEDRKKYCEKALTNPETKEEMELKKELDKKIKDNINDVLKRADKEKIPMEIPQAKEVSTKEILEQEVEAELLRARADMKSDGERIEREEEEKKLQQMEIERLEKIRKRKWAIVTIQAQMRTFLAWKIARRKAYKRYRKHFDIDTHQYYYEDRRTRVTSWQKPKVLGSYDLAMEDKWIVIHPPKQEEDLQKSYEDRLKDEHYQRLMYYYNPNTWEQRWDQPEGTILCYLCAKQFVTAFLVVDNAYYCEPCLASRCEEIVYEGQYRPQDITFHLIDGGKTDAQYMPLYALPHKTYLVYLTQQKTGVVASDNSFFDDHTSVYTDHSSAKLLENGESDDQPQVYNPQEFEEFLKQQEDIQILTIEDGELSGWNTERSDNTVQSINEDLPVPVKKKKKRKKSRKPSIVEENANTEDIPIAEDRLILPPIVEKEEDIDPPTDTNDTKPLSEYATLKLPSIKIP